jgi:hypothetical protein
LAAEEPEAVVLYKQDMVGGVSVVVVELVVFEPMFPEPLQVLELQQNLPYHLVEELLIR